MSACKAPVCRKADGGIRIDIPFDGVGTTAFLLSKDGETVIYDGGSSDGDARTYILPVIEEMGLRVTAVVASHAHGDHAGGIPALLASFPVPLYIGKNSTLSADTCHTVTEEHTLLLGRYRLIPLSGHSDDGLAVLDEEENVLYTGDTVQLSGIGRYAPYFSDVIAYVNTLRRVEALAPLCLVPSHAYAPFGQKAFTGDGVAAAIAASYDAIRRMADIANQNQGCDDITLAAAFRRAYPTLPPAYPAVMREAANMRERSIATHGF